MKKLALALFCLLGLAGALQAQTVTIKIDAGQLRGPGGTVPEPVGGLLQLIASPGGMFPAPTPTSYISGDNVVVMSLAMNNNGGTNETFNTLSALPLTTANYTLTTGEKLTLRFYPTLTLAAMPSAPGAASATYGQVRSDTIEFGNANGVPGETTWVVPSSGANVNFEYVTVSNNGSYSNASAYAVPEPSSIVIEGSVAMALFGYTLLRRRA